MGRSAGVRPNCSLNNGKNSRGKQLDGQAKSLTAGVGILGLPGSRSRDQDFRSISQGLRG